MSDRSGEPRDGDVAASWASIDAWLTTHAPGILASLRPGATEEELRTAEGAMGAVLPADVAASYAIHDGQTGSPPVFADWALLSLDGMVAKWSLLTSFLAEGVIGADDGEPLGPIRVDWWSPEWIPFAHNSSGDYCCIDLAPESGGHVGQIISYLHADPRREVLARDFAAWLRQFAADLDAGRYRVEDEWLERVD